MPKSGVDGPTYAGHVNVNPHGDEPEWVLAQDVPAQPAPTPPAVEVEDKPVERTAEPVAPRRAAKRTYRR